MSYIDMMSDPHHQMTPINIPVTGNVNGNVTGNEVEVSFKKALDPFQPRVVVVGISFLICIICYICIAWKKSKSGQTGGWSTLSIVDHSSHMLTMLFMAITLSLIPVTRNILIPMSSPELGIWIHLTSIFFVPVGMGIVIPLMYYARQPDIVRVLVRELKEQLGDLFEVVVIMPRPAMISPME